MTYESVEYWLYSTGPFYGTSTCEGLVYKQDEKGKPSNLPT